MNAFDFIIGILFATVALPLISSLESIIEQLTEFICVKIAAKTTKVQLELQKSQIEEQGEEQTYAIGFQIPSTPEEYYDDDDEDQEGDD